MQSFIAEEFPSKLVSAFLAAYILPTTSSATIKYMIEMLDPRCVSKALAGPAPRRNPPPRCAGSQGKPELLTHELELQRKRAANNEGHCAPSLHSG